MRILLVTDWLRAQGGVEAYFRTLRDGLRDASHEVKLLTSTAGSSADGSAEYRAFGTHTPAAQAVLQVVNPFAVGSVRSALREFQPHIALVGMVEQHLSPAALGPLAAVPTILSIADYKPVCPIHTKLLPDGSICTVDAGLVCWRGGCVSLPHWLRDRPRYALLRRGIGRVDRIVTCSEHLRQALAAGGIDAEVLALPVASPAKDFARTVAPEPLFLFVGRLSVEKGVGSLLRAFARVRTSFPAATLRLVGDGAARGELERLAASLGLLESATFAGWLAPSDVERELAHAWALVAPSLWAEPFGLVAAEAIVHGVPVVASGVGGFAETVEPEVSGLLFANGDESALERCLADIAGGRAFPSHALSAEVVRAGLERFSPGRHVERLEAIFAEIVRS